MPYVVNVSTIGTAGRDFATVALWEASLPSNLTTGDGRSEFGIMHADSVFTEINTEIAVSTIKNLRTPIVLKNATGETPIWRPTGAVASSTRAIRIVRVDRVSGIIFDGANVTGLAVQGTVVQVGSGTGYRSCIFKNGPAHGARSISSNSAYTYCFFANNGFHGFSGGIGRATFNFCGFSGNTQKGASSNAGAGATVQLRGCWAVNNAGGSFRDIRSGNNSTGFNFIDDAVFTAEGTVGHGLNENQPPASLGFQDLSGENFRLVAASILRNAAGNRNLSSDMLFRDLNGDLFDHDLSSGRFDIGPFQGAPAGFRQKPRGRKFRKRPKKSKFRNRPKDKVQQES